MDDEKTADAAGENQALCSRKVRSKELAKNNDKETKKNLKIARSKFSDERNVHR